MDQFAALHWIQENIAEFGGDPNNVTVFGQGHGAACVNFLVLSPMAKGLFHRAIMQSGSALSPWAIAQDINSYAQNVARTLGCPASQSAAFLDCMRQRSVSDILRVRMSVPDFLTGFGPTVDGIAILNDPLTMMKDLADDPQYGRFDLIFGVTRVESFFHVSAYEERHGINMERRDRLLRTLVRNVFSYHLQEIFLTIVNEYTDWTKSIHHAINILDGSLDAIGDALIVAPVVKTASYHSVGPHKTYFYVFNYQTEDGDFPQRQGCVHGEDLPYVFGAPLVENLSHFSRNYSKSEASLAEAVMTNWVNFAQNGDPNSPLQEIDGSSDKTRGKFERIMWPQYDNIHQKYLMIGLKPKVRDHYHAHRLSFWLHLFPKLHMYGSVEMPVEHHLLEDHDNVLSYDGMVRHISFTTSKSSEGSFSLVPLPSIEPTVAGTFWNASRRNFNHTTTTMRPPLTTALTVNLTDSLAVVMRQSSFSTALSVTIAVGCSLLVLNVLIFAGIYHQRGKNRQEMKDRKRNYSNTSEGQATPCPGSQLKPLRAPPPSPVCHSMQQHQHQLQVQQDQDVHHYVSSYPTKSNHLPPKVPPKPCIGQASQAPPPLGNKMAEVNRTMYNQRAQVHQHHHTNQQDMRL